MVALAAMLISFLAVGIPIGIALAGSAMLFILFDPSLTPNSLFRAFFSFLSSYSLMAIPFFIPQWMAAGIVATGGGIAISVLTVPIIFPVATTMGVDPIHLGILIALAVEMGGVIPPVGLNLFAVSGTTGVPLTRVMRGAFPFLCTDGMVMWVIVFFPIFALWIPNMMAKSIF